MPGAWTLKEAGQFLRRTTFGFTASQLYQAVADGPETTLERLQREPASYADFERSLAALAPREPDATTTAQLLLYRILHSPYPYREKSRCAPGSASHKVKSPLEFALNLAIPLGVQLAPASLLMQLSALGQQLPQPGGPEPRWLNAFTVIGRSNLAASIVSKVDRFPDRKTLLDTLLQDDGPARLAGLDGRELVQAIANLPEFQLL